MLTSNRLTILGKGAKQIFTLDHALPYTEHTYPSKVFYVVNVFAAIIFWSFTIVWFVVAVVIIALARRFPFSMDW